MRVNYISLANATAVTHIVVIFLVLIGILISLRYKRFRPIESAALLLVILLWSVFGYCPLTILEYKLRMLAGQHTTLLTDGFLRLYINKYLGLNLSRRLIAGTTFTTGSLFFLASIEMISPYINIHLFHLRKSLKKAVKRRGRS